ncbi:MAG TPA: thiamine phosphate synthase, partial [Candidatus Binatia bacterium]|nr:thiamine phosphate synthase [Candidatus Binatia bacterium]
MRSREKVTNRFIPQPSPRLQPPLYAILDPEQTKGRATETVLRELLEGGIKLLQLRAKAMIPVDFLRLACATRALTRSYT